MKPMICLLLSSLLATITLAAAPELVELESVDGHKISAQLLSLDQERLRLERDDDEIFVIEMDLLSTDSQERVHKWFINHLPEEAFELRFKERVDHKYKRESNSRKSEAEVIYPIFSLDYKGSVPIEGAHLEFRIYYEQERLGRPKDSFTTVEMLTATVQLPTLVPGETVEVKSDKRLDLWESKLLPGFVSSYGHSGPAKDKIIGHWLRLKYKGKVLYQISSPRRYMEREEWADDAPENPFSPR
jgi:hypothetical protein